MRVIEDTDDYDGEDYDNCPNCKRFVGGLADEVSDGDYHDEDMDVAEISCPACGHRIALVRTHSYSLRRFAE